MFHSVSTGQSSSAAKLKSLTGALEVMTETRYAFQLIHKELLEDQTEVYLRVAVRTCSPMLIQLCKALFSYLFLITL